MRGSHGFFYTVFLLFKILNVLAKEECEEFSQTRGIFKICKKVESQRSQSSSMFHKVLELETQMSWFNNNKEAFENLLTIVNSFAEYQKQQLNKDLDQDMKLSAVDGKVEAVKEHFFKVLNDQALNEAILDKKFSMENEAVREEIKAIKMNITEQERRISSNAILLESKEAVRAETLSNITESISQLNITLMQKMKVLGESQLLTPVSLESPPYFSSDRALEGKLSDVATSLRNQMAKLRSQSEAELFNLTSFVEDRLHTISTNVETRLNNNVALVRDSIFNASSAFVEDVEVLRQLLSNTSNTVAYLSGRDLMSVRSVEELKSTARRQDAILQTISKQLQDLQHGIQDQLQNVRSNFQTTMVDIYQKISDRQNQMSQRLTTVVDEVTTLKTRVRNIMAAMLVPVTTPKTSPTAIQIDEFDATE